jgi:hypothetical protein
MNRFEAGKRGERGEVRERVVAFDQRNDAGKAGGQDTFGVAPAHRVFAMADMVLRHGANLKDVRREFRRGPN